MNSDTPRTDAKCKQYVSKTAIGNFVEFIPADFARTLEGELAAKDAEIAELKDKVVSAAWEYGKQKARAEKAEAELVRANQAIDHIDAAANSMLAKAESERDALRAEVEVLKKDAEGLALLVRKDHKVNGTIDQLRAEVEGLRGKVARLAVERDRLHSDLVRRDDETEAALVAAQEDKARLMHIFHHDAPKPEPGDHFNEWLAAIDAARKA